MFCKNCGAEMPEDAKFCGNCGMEVKKEEPVQEAPAQEEPSPFASQPLPHNIPGISPMAWIVLSVLEIIFCCSAIPGIVGLIFSIMAETKKNQGNFAEAEGNLKVAKIACWVGVGLFVVSLVISTVFGFFAEMLEYL